MSADIERLTAERDAALAVAIESFRSALTGPIYEDGKAGPSIADLSGCNRRTNRAYGESLVNWELQYAIADEMRKWMVPPAHRPTCPLNGHPCTSWTCLVDVCADEKWEAS